MILMEDTMQKLAIAAVTLTVLVAMLIASLFSGSVGMVLARAEGYSDVAVPVHYISAQRGLARLDGRDLAQQ
jgi:hypothetical protein